MRVRWMIFLFLFIALAFGAYFGKYRNAIAEQTELDQCGTLPVKRLCIYLPTVSRPKPPSQILGVVTSNNVPVAGVPLKLMHSLNNVVSEMQNTFTLSDGSYGFENVTSLTSSAKYFVSYTNDAKTTGYILWWNTNPIEQFTEGTIVRLSAFDIGAITLNVPVANATASFPVEFRWTPRAHPVNETYRLVIANGPVLLVSDYFERSVSFLNIRCLNRTDPPFIGGQPYEWSMGINGAGGSGESLPRILTFAQVVYCSSLHWDR